MSGREIRVIDHPPGPSDVIADVHQGQVDAAVLRGAFPEPLRRAVLDRLADDSLPWLRPNRTGPQADIRVLGVAATPTFETPGGPAVDGYFTDAARYDALYDQMLGVAALERLLASAAGGRPVERLVGADRRPFAACTVRSLPEGQRIIVHNDHGHYQLPVYRGILERLDTTTSLSFLVLLQAPEAGGELVIHGVTHADPVPRTSFGMPDGAAIAAQFPSRAIAMAAGDVCVFAAGRFYHHVAPVIGATPRITLGGFMTLDRDHARVVYWN